MGNELSNCDMCREIVQNPHLSELELSLCRHCGKKFCKKPGCGETSDYGAECGSCFLKIEGDKHPLWKRIRDQVDKNFANKSRLEAWSANPGSNDFDSLNFSSEVLHLAKITTTKAIWIEELVEGKCLKIDKLDYQSQEALESIPPLKLRGLGLILTNVKQLLEFRSKLPLGYQAFIYHFDNIDGKNIALTVVLKNTSMDEFLCARNTSATNYGLNNKNIRKKIRHWLRYYDIQIIGAEQDSLIVLFPKIEAASRRMRLSRQILNFCPQLSFLCTEKQLLSVLENGEVIHLGWS